MKVTSFCLQKTLVKFPRFNSQHPYERKHVERCQTSKSLTQFIFNTQELKGRFYSSEVKSFRRAFIFSVQNVFLRLSEIFIGDFHSSFTQRHQTCLSTDSLKLQKNSCLLTPCLLKRMTSKTMLANP